MHFHLPKPLHGWRAFAGEVGIIVLGVLIALLAEQAVEAVHWRLEVADASKSLDGYLRHIETNVVQRVQIDNCIDRKLDRLDNLISASDRPKIVRVELAPSRIWTTSGWQSVIASGAAAHMSLEQRGRYALVFDSTSRLAELNIEESGLVGELQLLNQPRTLSQDMRDQLIEDIARLRRLNMEIARFARQWLRFAEPLHLHMLRSDVARLRQSDRCVMPDDPAAKNLPPNF
jgi:hypothetical protein